MPSFVPFQYAAEYVILCSPADEKHLIKNVNRFLSANEYRKLYKWKPEGIRNIESPEKNFRYSHYYCQFLKQQPRWHLDLTPNEDLDGRLRIPDRATCAWSLHIRKVFVENYTTNDHLDVDRFFADLVNALGFEAELYHTFTEKETRL